MKRLVIPVLLFFSLSFGDKNLLWNLVKRAEKESNAVKAQEHRVKASDWRIKQVISKYKPKISADVYLGYQEYRSYYTRGKKSNKLKYYDISLTQPLFYPEVFTEYQQEKINKAVQELYLEKEKQDLRNRVIKLLLDIAYTNTKINLYKRQVSLREEQLSNLKVLLEKKLISKDTFKLYKESYLVTKSLLREEEEKLTFYKTSLKDLIRGEIPEGVEKFSLKKIVDVKGVENFISALSVSDNLDIRISNLRYEHAKKEIDKRKRERLPKVNLRLSYLYSSSSVLSTASRDKRASITIYIPIYEGGYYSYRINEAKELALASLEEYRDTERSVKQHFNEVLNQFKRDISLYKSQYEVWKLRKELLRLTREAYLHRIKSKSDLLEAEIKLSEAEERLYESVYRVASDVISLLYITSSINPKNVELIYYFLRKTP